MDAATKKSGKTAANKHIKRPVINMKDAAHAFGRIMKELFEANGKRLIVVAVCLVIAAIATSGASIYIINMVGTLFDSGKMRDEILKSLITGVIVMAFIYLLGIIAQFLRSRIMAVVTQKFLDETRKKMFNGMQNLPVKYFDTHTHGDIMSHYTNDIDAIREMVSNLIIHQQLDVRGAGPMVEIFSTRIETSNPGNLLVDVNRIIDTAPHSRNEAMASFLRIIRVCEERGSGFDRMEEGLGELKIPAPKVETGDDFTRTKLYWYPELSAWAKEDKIRTCYLSICYNYVNDISVSNAVLRNRFGVEDKNKAIVSRIIKDTLEAGLIKLSDKNAAPKMRRYIPYWA